MDQIGDEEKNKQNWLALAGRIFQTLKEYDRVSSIENNTPRKRYELCLEKYKLMCDTFPMVMTTMTNELRYSEKAFHRYLDKVQKEMELWKRGDQEHKTEETMKKFSETQSLYVKYLYMQECADHGKHFNPKTAKRIYEEACSKMMAIVNNIQKEEKNSKSAFEKESQLHNKERQTEFFNWLQLSVAELKINEPETYKEITDSKNNLSKEILETFKEDTTEKQNSEIEKYKALQQECSDLENQLKLYNIKPKKTPDVKESIRNMKEQIIQAKNAEDDDWISSSLVGPYVNSKTKK